MLSFEEVSNQGERVLEGDREEVLRSHRDRYRFASEFLEPGDLVLDAACGSGYGCSILAETGASVVGLDTSATALEYARAHCRSKTVSFQLGSVTDLEQPAEKFDAYCSFETVEHVEEPEKLIAEAARVLKKRGVLILSTPNRISSELAKGQKPENPFHLFEWDLPELDSALRAQFVTAEYYGQRIRSRNKFHPLYVESKVKRLFSIDDIVRIRADTVSVQPMNFIAVCRKSPKDGKSMNSAIGLPVGHG